MSSKRNLGKWVKEGKVSGDPMWPGSYAGYQYHRKTPKSYKKTPQQKKVAEAGRAVRDECGKGKFKGDKVGFALCRSKVMERIFK